MGDVYVPYLKPCPLAVKPSGAQGAEAPLMGKLGQGVGLVKHLREFSPAKEVVYGGHNGLTVDKCPGSELFSFLPAHPLLHRPA